MPPAEPGSFGSTPSTRRHRCPQAVAEMLNLPSEQALIERVRRRRHPHGVGQLRTCRRRRGRSDQSTARLDRRSSRPGDKPAAPRGRRRDRLSAGAADRGGFGAAVHQSSHSRSGRGWTVDEDTANSIAALCRFARRSAAGHRTGRCQGEIAFRAGNLPPTRRPVRGSPGSDAADAPSAAGRWVPQSAGATTCCSPTTNGACGHCPVSPAAHRWPPSSMCSPHLTYRTPPRSMSSTDSSTGRWSRPTSPVMASFGTGCWTAFARSQRPGWRTPLFGTTPAARTPLVRRQRRGVRGDGAGSGSAEMARFHPPGTSEYRRGPGLGGGASTAARGANRERIRLGLGGSRRRHCGCRADPGCVVGRWRLSVRSRSDHRAVAGRLAGSLGRGPGSGRDRSE